MGKAIIMMLIVITVFNKHWSYMNSKHCDLWRACISQTPCDLIITPTVGTEDGGKSLDSPTESWDLLASPWLGWPGAACSPEHRTGCHAPPGCISEGLIASISWSPGPPGKKSTPSPTGRHGEHPSPGQPPISLQPSTRHVWSCPGQPRPDWLMEPTWHHVKQKKSAGEPSLNPWPSKLWNIIKWNCFKTVGLGCGFKF